MKIRSVAWFMMGTSLAFGEAEAPGSISQALEDLYNPAVTESKLPETQPVYMKVIKSRTEERSTLIYRCRHVEAKEITDSVESATSPTGTVETSDEQNLITVNDVNEQIDEVKELILSLDIRSPQVLVEAQIIEVQMGDGMEWDTGLNITYDDESSIGEKLGSTKGYPVIPGAFPEESGGWLNIYGDVNNWVSVHGRLRWLETQDKAEILSSPNLLVDLGATATMSTGTDQPLLNVSVNNGVSQESVYYKRTGVNLRVTPELVNEDMVTIQVRPEVTTVVAREKLSATSEAPVISVRNIDTKLNVQNGGLVMMGGLYSSKEIESEERVPFLSSIPYLGRFFTAISTSQEKVQLIFLLKVTIVPDSSETSFSNMNTVKQEVEGAGTILRRSIMSERQGEAE